MFLLVGIASAQRVACVDTKYILDNISEYRDAQSKLDALSIEWQKEIEMKFAEIDKLYTGKAYEPNYSPFTYAKRLFEQKNYQVDVINQPFEFHFTLPNLPEYHLAISFPYTDREISSMETCSDCRRFKNYCYYIMNKSMDILQDGGFGVFAIPAILMDKKVFEFEIDCITAKANVLSIEQFKDYAIIVLQKDKLN